MIAAFTDDAIYNIQHRYAHDYDIIKLCDDYLLHKHAQRNGGAAKGAWPALPKSVTLFGEEYRIELVQELAAAENEYANVNFYRHLIQIDAACDLAVQWSSLCHEVVHIIDHHLMLSLDEPATCRIASGLFEFVAQLGVTAELIEGIGC